MYAVVLRGSSASLLSGGQEGAGCGGTSDVNISNAATDGGLHSRSAGTHPDVDVESSVDSGHGGTGGSRFRGRTGASIEAGMGEHPRASPLVFDPQHFSGNSPLTIGSSGARVVVDVSPSADEFRPISTLERLVKTNSIWLLASLSRAGAVHILKDRDTGNFIVRKSSQPHSLALSVQSKLCGHPAVDHYLIQGTTEDFWSSSLSRKTATASNSFLDGQLHKSQSEPINIQKQPSSHHAFSHQQIANNTPPSTSAEGFSHFMHTQAEMEKYFSQQMQNSSTDNSPFKKHHDNFVSSGDSISSPVLQVTTAVVVSLPNSNSMTSLTRTASSRALPALPSEFPMPSQFSPSPDREQLQSKSSPSPEPIYSVSKKQKKKTSQPLVVVADCDLVAKDSSSDLFTVSAVANPDMSTSLAYEVSPLSFEPSSLSRRHLAEKDEDPYRRSTSNKLMDPATTTSTSCEQQLLRAANIEDTKENSEAQSSTFVPRPKANLYFTTNLHLLEIPGDTYFTSNLSDRLSDYEDIWRTSSCAESDQDHYHRHGKKQFHESTTRMIADPRSVMDARFSQQQSPVTSPKDKVKSIPSVPSNTGKRKVLRKTSRDSPVFRPLPTERDAVTGGSTGLTALEQARKIAGSTSDEDSVVSPNFYPHHQPPPVAHVKGIRRLASVYDYEDEEDKDQEEANMQQVAETSPHVAVAVPTSITPTTSNRTVAVSKTAVVTNTNSIHILPSRPNQIKFITSHSLDFSPRTSNSLSPQHVNSATQAVSSMALTPTPTSIKSLPASIAKDATQTCVFTTTMAVHVSQASDRPAAPPSTTANIIAIQPDSGSIKDNKTKEKPGFISPLSRLSRLKSSSESSLATVSSPLYAEPADAVKLRDKHGKAINIQIRRQSAPSGPQQLLAAARNKERQQHQTPPKVSQYPKLDTILSPGAVANNKMAAGGSANKFTFEDVNVGSTSGEVESCSRPSLARSHSLRTPNEHGQFQRKQSWKERLNRLKLGTRVLTRNLTPPSAPSARKHQYQAQLSAETYDNFQVSCDQAFAQSTAQVPPSPNSPGKFPVLSNPFFDPRASIFSESSTIQDLISSAHPELSVRPIVNDPPLQSKKERPNAGEMPGADIPREVPAAPSEYDNLGIYRASTHSSVGTIYLPPWEVSAASRLMQESPKPVPSSHQEIDRSNQQHPPPLPSQPPLQELSSPSLSNVAHQLPPAMNFQERIARWQESNTTYLHQHDTDKPFPKPACSKGNKGAPHFNPSPRSANHGSTVMQGQFTKNKTQAFSQQERFLQQQQQLLHHQHQLKNTGKESKGSKENRSQLKETLQKQSDFPDNSQCQPLPPLSPVSLVSSNMANSVQLPTVVKMSTSAPLSLSPTPLSSSATLTSPHRLSSHCPDVVHCHSTPVPPTPTSSSFLNPTLSGRDADNSGVTAAQMIGEDDVLFGGSFNMASPELQRQISPILSQEFSKHQDNKAPGTRIREYIFKLSSDHQTIFGSTIENFIQCTLESQETNPEHVMRNVRQFMTGIKNYLVKHGEGMLEDLIERERNKLGANEILNIDAIIEQALHVCVLKPLKYHIYHLFVEKYNANGALEQLSRNIKFARTKSAQDLGVKPGLKVPGHIDMEVIKYYLDLMQKSYSPLQKLQNLLKATSTIYHCVQGKHHQFPSRGPSSLGADDFLPMLIYVLVRCGLVAAEIEADFMWGLLQQSLLTGEGGYYLTTLSSAVLVLKNFQETHDLAPTQHEGHLPTLSDMQGFLKIAIPDELHGSITWKTLPVRPNMNTKDVCALVAHKFKVTNPQDYGLFLLCDGQESQMAEGDCPQVVKGDYLALKKTCFFAFKRLDANIAWPKQIQESALSVTDTM
ncbi:Ras and Rab interactor 2RAS and EF-hand domain-containing protein [Elysia marginata]|uniref:Ras and Rab interactor 2RAS and EF-hand domain-containing protein n=1 Tax=Elysia marginata TaxID=1093978 RepID=A0AAV4IQB2_9GAST|nr:Ras and Rab interactor 2RAS and EF-hand domain-containing protein [Elysia marginata]